MEVELIETLVKFRLAIGYLGEREQFGWWQSSFFTQGSDAFLTPIFGRTKALAQCNGVTQAAAIIHDERIGTGKVYHLFRLPEDFEQSIHNALHAIKSQNIINNKEAALSYLKSNSIKPGQSSLGPTRVGDIKSIIDPKSWQIAAGLYLHAFENGVEIFPYFTDNT